MYYNTVMSTATTHRTNQFAGTCVKCDTKVEAGAGYIERNLNNSRWQVFHFEGECPEVQAAPSESHKTAEVLPDVPAGHYAVISRTGNNDLDFFRVDRPIEGRWAGRTFVKRIIGGRPDQAIRNAEQRQALERIANDIPGAAQIYGQQVGRCCICNRTLTDEVSRAAGIGPDCSQIHGIPRMHVPSTVIEEAVVQAVEQPQLPL